MIRLTLPWSAIFVDVECISASGGRFIVPRRGQSMPVNRRVFLARGIAATAGLIVGVRLPETLVFAQENEKGKKKPPPNPFIAYVHVKPTGEISLIIPKSEMGQGIRTGL